MHKRVYAPNGRTRQSDVQECELCLLYWCRCRVVVVWEETAARDFRALNCDLLIRFPVVRISLSDEDGDSCDKVVLLDPVLSASSTAFPNG